MGRPLFSPSVIGAERQAPSSTGTIGTAAVCATGAAGNGTATGDVGGAWLGNNTARIEETDSGVPPLSRPRMTHWRERFVTGTAHINATSCANSGAEKASQARPGILTTVSEPEVLVGVPLTAHGVGRAQ